MISIAYDATCDVIWMSYRRDPFPAGTLQANTSGDWVIVTQKGSAEAVLTVSYNQVTDSASPPNTFASATLCAGYLNGEFAKRRPLGTTFVQATPTAVWTIPHDLSFQPKVLVIDTAGDPVLTDTRYPSSAVVELRFSAPTAGTAYLS